MKFIDNYLPRSLSIKKTNNFQLIKFGLIFFFITTVVITLSFSLSESSKMEFNENLDISEFNNKKNIVKINDATLIGNDKNKRPYVITSKTSYKSNTDENVIQLYSVKADITLKDESWFFLSTDHAYYNILEKKLVSKEKVAMFYDNGTTLESNHLEYNIDTGIAKGFSGVKMYGNWGNIISGSFSLDLNNNTVRFLEKPRLIID